MNPVNEKMTTIPERFPAEIWDQMQLFFQEYNDHQLHATIYFKTLLDFEFLKKAIISSMDIVPLLGSRFVPNKFKPYWERVSHFNEHEIISLVNTPNPHEEINKFLIGITNELTGPQLMARVIRYFDEKDTLCIVMNHMVCDGAGFKEYLYLLAKLYTQQCHSTGNELDYKNGSRSSEQLYQRFNFFARLKLFFLPNEPLANKSNIYFPLSKEMGIPIPCILIHKISPECFHRLKKYSKEHAVTINDIVLAAYYRALYKTVDITPADSLTIPCMIDLRRYLPFKKADGICNLSSMIMCDIGPEIGDTFEETVIKVSRTMNQKKNEFPGMHGLATLNILFRLLPFSIVRKVIKRNYVNPLIGMTNIGIIDSSRLTFGNLPIKDAFVTGSIKYHPYFQLALTTYNCSITFSINLYGFQKDVVTIKRFFTLIDEELKSI